MNQVGASSCMYGIRLRTRSLCSVDANTDKHRYLVGTYHTNANNTSNNHQDDNNEIHLIEYDEDNNEINCISILSHRQEIWGLASSYKYDNIFASIYIDIHNDNNNYEFKSTVWKIKDHHDNNEVKSPTKQKQSNNINHNNNSDELLGLDKLIDLTGNTGRINKLVWHPVEGEHKLVTCNSKQALIYDLNQSHNSINNNSILSTKSYDEGIEACVWDPHHSQLLVTVDNTNIRVFDLRENIATTEAQSIVNAHESVIRDVDYNPNKPYHIVTGSEDRNINIYDLRKISKNPNINANTNGLINNCYLRQLHSHTHWIWNVKFNRFHDQLILSAGTELVNLWSIVSTSSAPLGELESDISNNASNKHDKSNDKLIKTYNDHEDSIYAISWSSHDAWSFASLSYDGRVVINHVPQAEKYKILL